MNWKTTWEKDDPAELTLNTDGSVTFSGPTGPVFLPDDYQAFLLTSDGIGAKDYDARWFVTTYPDGIKILELEYLSGFSSVQNLTWGFQENVYHDGYTVPKGYIHIGTAEGDANYTSVLLSVRKGEPDYGKVFTWMQTQDPWMEGDNTIGLGFVADSFTTFMNNLAPRDSL